MFMNFLAYLDKNFFMYENIDLIYATIVIAMISVVFEARLQKFFLKIYIRKKKSLNMFTCLNKRSIYHNIIIVIIVINFITIASS